MADTPENSACHNANCAFVDLCLRSSDNGQATMSCQEIRQNHPEGTVIIHSPGRRATKLYKIPENAGKN